MSARPVRRYVAALTVGVTLGASALLSAPAGVAGAAPSRTVSPVVGLTSSEVNAVALPTAQINGIVWSQVVLGNTVYAGGMFSTARPAGVAVGGAGEVRRTDLMSYDITTGVMTDFAPTFDNGTVQTLSLSPDGSRLYAGGTFTSVNGQNRYRVAAFDTATGALLPFAPSFDYTVFSILDTGSTVYIGGAFTSTGSNSRPYLAAFTTGGALTAWAPVADGPVRALAATGDGGRIVVAGSFTSLNGVEAKGLGSVDPSTAATQDFPANKIVYAYGQNASFFSLAVQGNTVYGSAYKYMGTGNLEGAFGADASTGELTWLEDCHGDTYSVFPTPEQVYVAGHPHFCKNIGGYGQTAPPQRALAFTTAVTGTVQPNTQPKYPDLQGNPSPSMTAWFPTLTPGTVSGSSQAAWSVSGNRNYVVLGGEFPTVNGVAQQGLVRFAVPSLQADTIAPTLSGDDVIPKIDKIGRGVVRVSFTANYDRDDLTLNYAVQRDTGEGTDRETVWQTTANSTFWNTPLLAVADTGLVPGAKYRYRVVATDAAGNQAVGSWRNVTAPVKGDAGANAAPIAAGSVRTSADGASVDVDGTASHDSDGQVSRYLWDFGDGTTSTSAVTTHTYSVSGKYTITLTVTDDDAATGTTSFDRLIKVRSGDDPAAPATATTATPAAATTATPAATPAGTVSGTAR